MVDLRPWRQRYLLKGRGFWLRWAYAYVEPGEIVGWTWGLVDFDHRQQRLLVARIPLNVVLRSAWKFYLWLRKPFGRPTWVDELVRDVVREAVQREQLRSADEVEYWKNQHDGAVSLLKTWQAVSERSSEAADPE